MVGQVEEFRERSHRTARYHVETPGRPLGSRTNHMCRESELQNNGLKELAAQPPRLNQGDGTIDEARKHNPGEPGPRTNIDPGRPRTRLKSDKLGGV